MKIVRSLALAAAGAVIATTAAFAQQPGKGPGSGPVITQCADDITKYCAGKSHNGEVRACLEGKKQQVSAACRTALETTGGGKGRKQ